jgi:hypothetical protein
MTREVVEWIGKQQCGYVSHIPEILKTKAVSITTIVPNHLTPKGDVAIVLEVETQDE